MQKSFLQFLFFLVMLLTVMLITCTQPVENKDTPQILSSAKVITAFSFPNIAICTINETSHTITVTVPYGANVTSLAPAITHTGASVNPASGITQNFISPVIYTVTAADASTQTYTITVFRGADVTTAVIAGNFTFTADINGTTAKGGGNVTNLGASAVTERGLCWNTAGSPAISGTHAADGSGIGIFSNVSLTGLIPYTVYYVRAYAANSQGTVYGNEIILNSGYAFGTDYAGGYVFYNNGSGGGLVSAKSDQSSEWWIRGGDTLDEFNGNTSTAFGTGLANSYAIIAQAGHTGSAAKVCLDYDDGVYSDWFLPSNDELSLMYYKLKVNNFGSFADYYYWNSSEQSALGAYIINFPTGVQYVLDKYNTGNVRAVRVF